MGLLVAGGMAAGLAAGLAAGWMVPRLRTNRRGFGLTPPVRAALGLAGELALALAIRALEHEPAESAEQDKQAHPLAAAIPAPKPAQPPDWRKAGQLILKAWSRRKGSSR